MPMSAEPPQASEREAKESVKSADIIFSDINDIKSAFQAKPAPSERSKVTTMTGKLSRKPPKDKMKVEDIVDEEKLSDG